MIIIINSKTKPEKVNDLVNWIERKGLKTHITEGDYQNIIGVIGDTSRIDEDQVKSFDIVEAVKRVSEPFKQANRKFHPHDTVVEVTPEVKIGHGNFGLIAGPCSVECEEQIIFVAQSVKAAGATMLRGGAFKPRTSPYDFQGLKAEGLKLLLEAKKAPRTSPYDFQGLKAEGLKLLLEAKKVTGLPIVTEIMSAEHIPLFEDVDVIQVGARNMQNFELLKELGKLNKPILLKRGLANTIKELLMSAEYIMSSGNENVILCERGIRTYETATRNTLDLSAVPVLHELSHLPVVVDPSHATGVARYVKPMAMAAVASGADGLIIEVHNDPPHALSDGAQSLRPEQFADVSRAISLIRKATIEANA